MNDLFQLDPGWHYDVPMPVYVADPGLGSSGLQDYKVSAKYYRFRQNRKRAPTKAMTNGSAFHTCVLEPDDFDKTYVIAGQCEGIKGSGERCKNPGVSIYRHRAYCGVKGHHPAPDKPMPEGMEIVEQDARDAMLMAKENLHDHATAMHYFRGVGASEVTGIWIDEATGVRCKIRLDRELKRVTHHVDLKYTASAAVRAFKRQTFNMGWMSRSAFYRRGMRELGREAEASVIIAAESEPAHDCNVFILDENQIEIVEHGGTWDGRKIKGIDAYLVEFAECLDSGKWPGYDQDPVHLTMEAWQL